MTQIGESAQASSFQEIEEENHWLEIDYKYPEGAPVEGNYIATDSGGIEHIGLLNDQGGLRLNNLPAGSVEVELVESVDDPELKAIRVQIKSILDEILVEKRAETSATDARLARMSPMARQLERDKAFLGGLWNGAVGLVEFAWDAVKTAAEISQYLSPLEKMNNLLEATYKSYQSGELSEEKWLQSLADNMKQEELKDLVQLLGFDPRNIKPELFSEAYEIASFIAADEATLDLLTTFAKEYAGAQSELDWAEFAGGGVFEIVLAALLAAFTGGLGNVAQAASKVRHTTKLRRLGVIFRRLGKLLKRKRLNKKIKVSVDQKKKVDADMPEGARVTKRAPRRSCECFNMPRSGKTSRAEMQKQLDEQKNKINSMDPLELQARRNKVKALQNQNRGLGSLRDAKSQSDKRVEFRNNEIDRLSPSLGRKAAKIEVAKMMEGLDATHALDIVAGGNPYDISGLQDRAVNRSMGSQWMQKGRLDDLDKAIADAIGPPKRKMNFDMKLCD